MNDLFDDGRTDIIKARAFAILECLDDVKNLLFISRIEKDGVRVRIFEEIRKESGRIDFRCKFGA